MRNFKFQEEIDLVVNKFDINMIEKKIIKT